MVKKSILPVTLLLLSFLAKAQTETDSAKVVRTLKELITICKTVDWADPKVSELGLFYKAAPYILYRGEDKTREWKDYANYNDPTENNGVNEVCYRINGSVNQDSSYKIVGYRTEKESEGVWHVVMVTYIKKGVEKKAVFAFLKVKDRFGLGDID